MLPIRVFCCGCHAECTPLVAMTFEAVGCSSRALHTVFKAALSTAFAKCLGFAIAPSKSKAVVASKTACGEGSRALALEFPTFGAWRNGKMRRAAMPGNNTSRVHLAHQGVMLQVILCEQHISAFTYRCRHTHPLAFLRDVLLQLQQVPKHLLTHGHNILTAVGKDGVEEGVSST